MNVIYDANGTPTYEVAKEESKQTLEASKPIPQADAREIPTESPEAPTPNVQGEQQ